MRSPPRDSELAAEFRIKLSLDISRSSQFFHSRKKRKCLVVYSRLFKIFESILNSYNLFVISYL